MSIGRSTILALSLALLAACGSSRHRADDAEQLEQQGDWEGAANQYFSLIGTDKEQPDTRTRAAAAVSQVLANRHEAAAGFAEQGRWEASIHEYRKGDALLQKAQEAGVEVSPPAGWDEGYRSAREGAVETQLAAADGLAKSGRWRDAAEAYRLLRGRQGITDAQTARAFAGENGALLDAARAEIASGNYEAAGALVDEALAIEGAGSDLNRAAQAVRGEIDAARYASVLSETRRYYEAREFKKALATVQRAIDVHGADNPASQEALDLKASILKDGTDKVAVVPTGVTEALAGLVPPTLQKRIDAALAEKHWNAPPPFVGIVDPSTVASTMVMLVFDDPVLSTRRAGVLGRKLESDYVVVVYLDNYAEGPQGAPTRHTAKHQDGHEVAYELYPGLQMKVSGGWRLISIDQDKAQVITEGTISSETQRDCPHVPIVSVELDPEKLQLTDEEFAWFDPAPREAAERTMLESVANDLADQIAKATFDQITSRVP